MVKLGRPDANGVRPVMYIRSGMANRILSGKVISAGRDGVGALIVSAYEGSQPQGARTQWNNISHDATLYGSNLLKLFLPSRKFPYPKSLYAVEDTLRWYVLNKKDAVILDFFAGSEQLLMPLCD
jgi:adenine-specific DNA-methyltransferase